MTTIEQAKEVWKKWEPLRRNRLRLKKYTFGEQWADKVRTDECGTMSEKDMMMRTGHHPATCNMILPAVTAIVGHYRKKIVAQNAKLPPHIETDCAALQEFLISGCAIQRLSVENRDGTDSKLWADNVSPANFFVDHAGALSPHRAQLLGQLHDMSLMHILLRFSRGNRRSAARLRDIFDRETAVETFVSRPSAGVGESVNDNVSFASSSLPGTMRVVEVWTLECGESTVCLDPETGTIEEFAHDDDSLNRRNSRRRRKGLKPLQRSWSLVPKWHCRFLTAAGTTLYEYYADSHPYVYAFYPLVDGEIHSMVEDLIERQRHINRLLTLNDRILASSAKGVLLFPENQTSPAMPVQAVADNWAAPDGIVLYRAMPGMPGPQQMVGGPANFGVVSMLQTDLTLFRDISGVSEALRGQAVSSNTGAELYSRQQEGASTAIAYQLGTFESFVARRDEKGLSIVQQCSGRVNENK